jgi:hypothetical protein
VGWADDFLRPAFRASPIRGGRSDALEALTLQTERHAHATHAADVIGGGRATSLARRTCIDVAYLVVAEVLARDRAVLTLRFVDDCAPSAAVVYPRF